MSFWWTRSLIEEQQARIAAADAALEELRSGIAGPEPLLDAAEVLIAEAERYVNTGLIGGPDQVGLYELPEDPRPVLDAVEDHVATLQAQYGVSPTSGDEEPSTEPAASGFQFQVSWGRVAALVVMVGAVVWLLRR